MANVSLAPYSSPSPSPPEQPPVPAQPLSPTEIATVVAGSLCLVVVVTAVVYCNRNCLTSRRYDYREQSNAEIELGLIESKGSNAETELESKGSNAETELGLIESKVEMPRLNSVSLKVKFKRIPI
jgi:hypothetical protein